MIGPIHAYTIVDASYRPWLEGWLFWHRERYDRLFVMLLDEDPECRRLIRRYGGEEMNIIGAHGLGLRRNPKTFITDLYFHIYQHAMNFGTRAWYSVIDVDEIVDPRVDLRALARWCQRRDRVVAFAHMIDRVAADGRPRALGGHMALFEDFPARVCFGRDITGWDYSKPFLRRTDFYGLHRIDNVRRANRFGCPYAFELCHFDFTIDNHARSVHKARIVREQYKKWFRQYDLLAQACEQGIDLDKFAMQPTDYSACVPLFGADEHTAIFGAPFPAPFSGR